MASDKDQETDHKTRKETRKTSLLLQTDSGGRTNNQPNISSIQWKLRRSNRIPNEKPTRLWLIILGHQQNQKLFCYHEDIERIVDIIQKGSLYHISPIEDATQKLYLEAMLIRGNNKSASSDLNIAAL